jgi:2-polyprenyl-6-methoxyphenol hydroxylase-like FAD-dependent oxidoreductase
VNVLWQLTTVYYYLAATQRGVDNILVIDQTRSFRRVGQVVDILPNGLKALKYIDEEAYQQLTYSPEFYSGDSRLKQQLRQLRRLTSPNLKVEAPTF